MPTSTCKRFVFLTVAYACSIQLLMPRATEPSTTTHKAPETFSSLAEKLKRVNNKASFGENKLIISKVFLTLPNSVINHKTVSLPEADIILSTIQKNLALFTTNVEPDSHEEQELDYIKSMFTSTEKK